MLREFRRRSFISTRKERRNAKTGIFVSNGGKECVFFLWESRNSRCTTGLCKSCCTCSRSVAFCYPQQSILLRLGGSYAVLRQGTGVVQDGSFPGPYGLI